MTAFSLFGPSDYLNNTTGNIHVQFFVCGRMFSFLLDILGGELLGQMVILPLTF